MTTSNHRNSTKRAAAAAAKIWYASHAVRSGRYSSSAEQRSAGGALPACLDGNCNRVRCFRRVWQRAEMREPAHHAQCWRLAAVHGSTSRACARSSWMHRCRRCRPAARRRATRTAAALVRIYRGCGPVRARHLSTESKRLRHCLAACSRIDQLRHAVIGPRDGSLAETAPDARLGAVVHAGTAPDTRLGCCSIFGVTAAGRRRLTRSCLTVRGNRPSAMLQRTSGCSTRSRPGSRRRPDGAAGSSNTPSQRRITCRMRSQSRCAPARHRGPPGGSGRRPRPWDGRGRRRPGSAAAAPGRRRG
jgi:hypothetical protein